MPAVGPRIAVVCAAALLLNSSARSQFLWANSQGGPFSDSANWLPVGPPSLPSDQAIFSLPSQYAVAIDQSSAHGSLTVAAGNVTFQSDVPQSYIVQSTQISGGSATLTGSLFMQTDELAVGSAATLNIDGAFLLAAGSASLQGTSRVSSGMLQVMGQADMGVSSSATLLVSGAGSQFHLPNSVSFWGRNPGGNARIEFSNGSIGTISTVALGVGTQSVATMSVLSGAALHVTNALTVASEGAATLTVDGGSLNAYAMDVGMGGRVDWVSGDIVIQDSLRLEDGEMFVAPGGDKVVRVGSINASPLGKIDLTDNPMLVDYFDTTNTVQVGRVRKLLQQGYNFGDWAGTGITSSVVQANPGTALVYIDNQQTNLSEFAGYAIDPTTVVVFFGVPADANFDNRVDVGDLGIFASNWQKGNATWVDGDFDYSGVVDVGDLGIIASRWQFGVGDGPSLAEALESYGLPASVPEPRTCAMLLMCTWLCAVRNRFTGSHL